MIKHKYKRMTGIDNLDIKLILEKNIVLVSMCMLNTIALLND